MILVLGCFFSWCYYIILGHKDWEAFQHPHDGINSFHAGTRIDVHHFYFIKKNHKNIFKIRSMKWEICHTIQDCLTVNEARKRTYHENYQLDIKQGQFTQELDVVRTKIKNRKAPSLDEIPSEAWETRKFDDFLFRYCNAICCNQNKNRERWTKGCILPFSKKGNLRIAKNYHNWFVGCFVLQCINLFRVIYQIKFHTIQFNISIVFVSKTVKTILFQGIQFSTSTV